MEREGERSAGEHTLYLQMGKEKDITSYCHENRNSGEKTREGTEESWKPKLVERGGEEGGQAAGGPLPELMDLEHVRGAAPQGVHGLLRQALGGGVEVGGVTRAQGLAGVVVTVRGQEDF